MEFSYGLGEVCDPNELEKAFDKGDFSTLVPEADKSLFDAEVDGMLGNVDWFDTLFDDAVLNDCMMSEAIQPNPTVKSEHSYSMHRSEEALDMRIKQEKMDEDFSCLGATIDPNRLLGVHEIKEEQEDEEIFVTDPVKDEIDVDDSSTRSLYTVGPTRHPQTLLRPTIILTSQPSVKVQPQPPRYKPMDSDSLPPTPPSSHGSDSDGCQSPDRSSPSTPERNSVYCSRQRDCGSSSLFMNPIPSSGVLLLSEEEKRTLVAEGYPVPQKLPLSKQEEKNLKKIRRKIKNKISAQESRRKKKEYVEGLERKVEAFSQENVDLRRKVDHLENNNRSLVTQLQKLQALVSKFKPSPAVANTGIMVLMLCFAVFLGAWSPATMWNASYGNKHGVSSVQEICVPPLYACWNVCCDPQTGEAADQTLQPPEVEDNQRKPPDTALADSVIVPARILLGFSSAAEDAFHCHRTLQDIVWTTHKSEDIRSAQHDIRDDGLLNNRTSDTMVHSQVIVTRVPLQT